MPQVKHVVLVRLKPGLSASTVTDLFTALAALKEKIPGLQDFSGGAYSSPEGLHRGFTHGFIMTFADEASRDAYLSHPEHEKVKADILPLLDGGLSAAIAFDWLHQP